MGLSLWCSKGTEASWLETGRSGFGCGTLCHLSCQDDAPKRREDNGQEDAVSSHLEGTSADFV